MFIRRDEDWRGERDTEPMSRARPASSVAFRLVLLVAVLVLVAVVNRGLIQ